MWPFSKSKRILSDAEAIARLKELSEVWPQHLQLGSAINGKGFDIVLRTEEFISSHIDNVPNLPNASKGEGEAKKA